MRNVLQAIACLLLAALPSLAVTVTAKSSGTTSPISIAATASTSKTITGWAIYVDSSLVYRVSTSSKSLTRWVNLTRGTHKVTVKAWNNNGDSGAATLTVTVSSTASASNTTSTTGL